MVYAFHGTTIRCIKVAQVKEVLEKTAVMYPRRSPGNFELKLKLLRSPSDPIPTPPPRSDQHYFFFHYIQESVLLENRQLIKFIRNYIRDCSGVFSISSLVRISITSFPAIALPANFAKRRLKDGE